MADPPYFPCRPPHQHHLHQFKPSSPFPAATQLEIQIQAAWQLEAMEKYGPAGEKQREKGWPAMRGGLLEVKCKTAKVNNQTKRNKNKIIKMKKLK